MTVEEISVPVTSIVNKNVGDLPTQYPTFADSIMDLFSLKNKNGIITGGARGIGHAISEAYCQAAISKLAIIDYSENVSSTAELQKKYPKTEIVYFRCDVRKANEVKEVINAITEKFEVIDIFVANAGIAWTSGALIDQEEDDEWHNVYNVDVNGVYYCAKNIGRVFRKQGKGSLIMTASMSAHVINVPNFQACYNSAKAAVLHLGRSLAIEWAPFARVNTISPGYIDSGLSDFVPIEQMNTWYKLTPKGRQGHPRELTGAYLYLASDASSFTTGSDMRIDGGYCAV